VTKGYKFDVLRVEMTEDSVVPEDAIPEDWELLPGTFIVFKINPRRSKGKGSGKGKAVKAFTKTTGWLEFSKTERASLKLADPELAFGDISREVGRRWKALSPEQQQVWKDLAVEITKQREEDSKSAPAEAEVAETKTKKTTGWILFGKATRSVIKSELPELSFGDTSKELGRRWKLLGSEGQATWKTQAKELAAV
jgi:hypothetical protein